MKKLIDLLNVFYKSTYKSDEDFPEGYITYIKEEFIDRGQQFLKRLIDSGHIEEIESEAKSGPTVNDYIKYIAATDDPIKTLSDMIK